MTGDWGPWIAHDGAPCPCVGAVVHVVIGRECVANPTASVDDGQWYGNLIEVLSCTEAVGIAEDDPSWRWEPHSFPVVRYRIRKPRGMALLEELVALPAMAPTCS